MLLAAVDTSISHKITYGFAITSLSYESYSYIIIAVFDSYRYF